MGFSDLGLVCGVRRINDWRTHVNHWGQDQSESVRDWVTAGALSAATMGGGATPVHPFRFTHGIYIRSRKIENTMRMRHMMSFGDFPRHNHRRNEAFDDERMKSRFEIDWLRGDLGRQIVSGEWGDTEWNKGEIMIESVMNRLMSLGLHQLMMFVDVPEIPGLEIKHWVASQGPDRKIFFFGVSNPSWLICFGIKVLSFNRFDLLLLNGNRREIKSGLTLQGVADILRADWLPSLDYFDNPELLNYGREGYTASIN